MVSFGWTHYGPVERPVEAVTQIFRIWPHLSLWQPYSDSNRYTGCDKIARQMSIEPTEASGVCLTLEIWHPNCWTTRVTADTDSGLLGHTVYTAADGTVNGHFTVYGNTTDAVEGCIAEIKDTPLTGDVTVMQRRHDFTHEIAAPGNATQDIFVEYDPDNSITDSLVSRGFIYNAPIHIHDGDEYWPLFLADPNREDLHASLESLRTEEDADISIQKITRSQSAAESKVDLLSARQREILELACSRGYYGWPRTVSLEELATELDVSKPTLLEHLRKAEAKILNAELEANR